jgi:hypothetical protein
VPQPQAKTSPPHSRRWRRCARGCTRPPWKGGYCGHTYGRGRVSREATCPLNISLNALILGGITVELPRHLSEGLLVAFRHLDRPPTHLVVRIKQGVVEHRKHAGERSNRHFLFVTPRRWCRRETKQAGWGWSAMASGHGMRSSRIVCALVVCLCAMAGVSRAAVCPTQNDLQASSDTTGHFLYASITWERVEGNTVMFEITSAWRRKHHWPCKDGKGFNGPDGWPGLGQELSVVGLNMIDDSGESRARPQDSAYLAQKSAGALSTKFYPGDGTEYDLTLKVTSYSIKEDWLMGVSYVQHTYSKPQHSLEPFYPPHYVASLGDKFRRQPYRAVPWTAEFNGCCRQHKGEGSSFNFRISATVDLDDHIASPRLVTMPMLYIYPDTTNRIALCALSVAGKEGMVMKTSGTINYEVDDHAPASYEWSVESGSAAILRSNQTSVRNRCTSVQITKAYTAKQVQAPLPLPCGRQPDIVPWPLWHTHACPLHAPCRYILAPTSASLQLTSERAAGLRGHRRQAW